MKLVQAMLIGLLLFESAQKMKNKLYEQNE